MKKKEKANININLKPLLIGLIILNLSLILFIFSTSYKNENDYIKMYYESEAATLVSPHNLRERIDRNESNFILVDTRNKDDYEYEHIKGSVNIPGYEDEKWLVKKYLELIKENPDKEIIIYCYTEVCMRGRTIGRILVRNNIFVKELGIGFNEWKNYWKKWNYEKEWEHINIKDYIETNESKKVVFNKNEIFGCSLEGTIDC